MNNPTKSATPGGNQGRAGDTTSVATETTSAAAELAAYKRHEILAAVKTLKNAGFPVADMTSADGLLQIADNDLRHAIKEQRRRRDAAAFLDAERDAENQTDLDAELRLFTSGGSFVFDEPVGFSPLWGAGDAVLWAEGEALIVAGPQGVGKSTLVGNVVAAALGDDVTEVLGSPVRPGQRVLYLAMDRPRQLARSMRRQLGHLPREVLDDRLTVWKGPPPRDLAKHTDLLALMADTANADVVVVDSLKDAAIGLVDDEVGASWNRARQTLLAAGRNVIEVHHIRKTDPKIKPTVADIYGSTWITSGSGSILLINGQPGDAHVTAFHVKQPAEDVGPIRIFHDATSGAMTVSAEVDLVTAAAQRSGMTAIHAARLVFDTDRPDRNQKEKTRRKLDAHVAAGRMHKRAGAGQDGADLYVAAAPEATA